jgi:hypothetical protein
MNRIDSFNNEELIFRAFLRKYQGCFIAHFFNCENSLSNEVGPTIQTFIDDH